MKKWLFLLSCLGAMAFWACSNPGVSSSQKRQPSSALDDTFEMFAKLDVSYQSVIQAPNAEQAFSELVERIVNMYYKSTALIQKFDRELKERGNEMPDGQGAFSAFQSETYVRVQVARALTYRLKLKFMYFYARLNEDRDFAMKASQGPAPSQEVMRLSKIRKAVHEMMKKLSKTEAIFAVEDLYQEMYDFNLQRLQKASIDGKKVADDKELKALSAKVIDRVEKHLSLHRNLKSRIDYRIKSAELDQSLEEEISNETRGMVNDFAFDPKSEDRKPSSGKVIFPSTSSAGNIVGGAFKPKTWVLTYDDGPHHQYTRQIMSVLEKNRLPGSFFWLAQNVKNPNLKPIVMEAKAKGYTLANHSMTHQIAFTKVSNGEPMNRAIEVEVNQAQQIETSIYGYAPVFYRCPYGACVKVPAVRDRLAKLNLIHAFWAVDSLDWNKSANPNGASDIYNRVVAQMNQVGKGVILFHDVQPYTAQATSMLAGHFQRLAASGHRVIDICDAVDEANGDAYGTVCPFKGK